MLYLKRLLFVAVVLLMLSLTLSLLVIAQEDTVITDKGSTCTDISTSLTYAEYAGLTQPAAIPSYQSSLTYPDYAGLTQPAVPTPIVPIN